MINPFDVIYNEIQDLKEKISTLGQITTTSPPEIIDRNELCKRLNITEPTCIRWEKKGLLPSFRIGSSVRYNWQKVIDTLETSSKL